MYVLSNRHFITYTLHVPHGRIQRGGGAEGPNPLENIKLLYVSLEIMIRTPLTSREVHSALYEIR